MTTTDTGKTESALLGGPVDSNRKMDARCGQWNDALKIRVGKRSNNLCLCVVNEREYEVDPTAGDDAHELRHQSQELWVAGSRRPRTNQHAGHRWEIHCTDAALIDLDVAGTHSGRNGASNCKEQE
jgi:hypothetical protein